MTTLSAGPHRLRPWARHDVEALPAIANDVEVARFMSRRFPHPYTRADAESWISLASEDTTKFAIVVDGALAGGIGFDLLKGEGTGTAEIGYWIGRLFWGRGIATVCLRTLVDHAFTALHLRRLQAHVMVPNYGSARVLEHNGFVCEGTLRSFTFDRDNIVRDNLLYARLNLEV